MSKQNKNKHNNTAHNKNVEFDELTNTENFFEKNKNAIIYGGVGIIVLILAFVAYQKFVSEPT